MYDNPLLKRPLMPVDVKDMLASPRAEHHKDSEVEGK